MHLVARIGIIVAAIASFLSTATPVVASTDRDGTVAADIPRYPGDMPPIGVGIVQDGLDGRGTWTQVIRLTIGSGGTLADASLLVFGDVSHIDVVFEAAKRKNPRLGGPALVPVGQAIDLPIAPSTTFAVQAILHRPNQFVQRFTNGVVDTMYQKPTDNVVRVISFPDSSPTDLFVYPSDNGPVKVRPGGKIVDVAYAPGMSFGDVVRQIYGLTTYTAAADLTKQTGWNPTQWPPSPGESRRVVVDPISSYSVTPAEAPQIPNPDPVGRVRQQSLRSSRTSVGITAIRSENFGQVYHVAINNPSLKASDVSTLLFGTTARAGVIASAAGFQVPGNSGGSAAQFDPHLFGRAFDLPVDYVDEEFVVRQLVDPAGITDVLLANGARIRTYPSDGVGPLSVVNYPTGYKRIIYRPPGILLSVANGLALFHAANDLSMSSATADSLTRRYVAEVIWRWGPSVPWEAGDLLDTVDLVDDPRGTYINALIAPPIPQTGVQRALNAIDSHNLFTAIAGLVVVATVLVLVAESLRRLANYRRPRW